MAAIANTRDNILQGATTRLGTITDRAIFLSATPNVIKVASDGTPSLPTVTFTASLLNMSGTVTFSVPAGDATLTANGNTAIMDVSTMADDSVTVLASITLNGITYQATQTIVKSRDGSNGTSGLNNGVAYAYKRSATAPTDNPGDVTYDFTNGRIAVPNTDDLANGWTKSIPSGTNPLYVTVASASGATSVDTILAAEWATPVVLSQNGANGLNVATVFLYQRTTTTNVPSVLNINAIYTFSTGAVSFQGTSNGWFSTIPPSGSNKYLWVSTATASSTGSTDLILPPEWSVPRIIAQDGSNGTPGSRGAGHFYVTITGSTWDDATATAACPNGPIANDVVTQSNGTTYVMEKYYDGSAWQVQGVVIDGGLIVPGSITTNQINANGLVIRSTTGTALVGDGVPLADALVPASAQNSQLTPIIQAAATNMSLVPGMDDSSWSGATLTNVSDGKVGTTTRRSTTSQTILESSKFTAIDSTKKYRVRFWARAASGTNGVLYHDLRQFTAANASSPNTVNGGRSPYQPGAVVAHTDWREYSFIWDSTNWQAGTTHVKPDFLLNYSGTAGYWEVQGYSFTDATEVVSAASTAVWGSVSGTGKPADNASSDVVLVGRGVVVTGNSAVKTAASGWGNADVYSVDSYTGGAYASVSVGDTASATMFGLNSDPTTDSTYTGIDWAVYLAGGTLGVYESGVNRGTFGTYAVGDVLAVIYDGSSVRYLKNGTVFYTSLSANAAVPNQTLFFDSAFNSGNATLKNIRFGPMSSNNWANVGGANRPADNASSDLVLTGTNVTISGNTVTKAGGTTGAWDAQAYSTYGYSGGAFASAVIPTAPVRIMFGLNTDPTTDANYTSIDYAIYPYSDGTLIIYESGVRIGTTYGTYAAGDVLSVDYDGSTIRYKKNGTILRELAVTITAPLFFDSSFLTNGEKLTGVRFGPLSSNAWGSIGGSGKPADNATVGADATNLNVTVGGDNLLSNSGFELRTNSTANRPDGWNPYNNAGSYTFMDVAGRMGGKAAAIRSNAAGAYTLGITTSNATLDGLTRGGVYGGWQPNKTYVVSFKARKVNGAAWTTCALRWNTQPTLTSAIFNPTLTTSWQTYAFRITLGATVETNGSLYIDRIGALAVNDEFHIDEVMVQETDVFSEWFLSSREAADRATGITLNTDGTLSGAAGAQGQVTLPGMGHNTFRVITNGSSVAGANMPATAGLYVNGVKSPSVVLGRSYTAVVIDRASLSIDSAKRYDVYGAGAQLYDGVARSAATLAADLNALPSTKIVVVISFDEPMTKRLDSGLDTAMYRCGASHAIFGSPNFKSRAAYVLVGIPGIGEGGGAEAYQGAVTNDTNAWVDIGFNIVGGALAGVSNNFTPKTLSDYGYLGGTLRTTNTGGRVEISDNVIKIYDSNNALRVKIGNLTL